MRVPVLSPVPPLVLSVALASGCSLLSPAPDAVAPAVAPLIALDGRVGLDDTRLTVFNDGDFEWTNVVATANGALACKLGMVHPHDQGGINFTSCSGALAGPIVGVKVTATQGYFEATTGPDPASVPSPATETVSAATAARPAARTPTTAAAPTASSAGSPPAASAAPPEATAPPATPAAQATPVSNTTAGPMALSANISGGIGPARRLTVFNNGSSQWTSCKVTANELYTFNVGTLEPGAHNGIMMIKFKDKAGNLFTSTAQVTKAKIACDQGSASVTPG